MFFEVRVGLLCSTGWSSLKEALKKHVDVGQNPLVSTHIEPLKNVMIGYERMVRIPKAIP